MQVHGGEDPRIDGILELIDEATSDAPLHEVLQRMCEKVARIAHADVASVYVREHVDEGDQLVLRANVGFAREVVGKVSMDPGEGITGFAAECLRPVSAASPSRNRLRLRLTSTPVAEEE